MHHKNHMKLLCEQYMHQPVQVQTNDHQVYHGIIEGVDDENVYLLIPNGMGMTRGDGTRQFGYNYYNPYYNYYNPYYYNYPYYPNYSYYPYSLDRLILPLTALAAISLLY